MLDGNLVILAGSKSFCGAFQIDPTAVNGNHMAGLGSGEWDIPQLDSLLRATANGFAEITNYELKLKRSDRPTRDLLVDAYKVENPDRSNIRILVSVADVTEARINEKLKDDLLREKAILLQELQHRVANSLQIIASVLMQSARRVQSEESRTHLYDAHNRVMSIATLQKQLASSVSDEVSLRPYLTDLCRSIGASMIQDRNLVSLEVQADETVVKPNISISIGLVVTELVINALKHAFPDQRHGRILVDYKADGSDWTLSVTDDGIGMADDEPKQKAGLGTNIVRALAAQLDAEIEVTNCTPGTRVSLSYRHQSEGDAAPLSLQHDAV
uniref:sensor histidine kinase n=1 Tax=Neorhizobium sp. EC2-8 TaxID=3129230 RepID=UPI0031017352